MKQKSKPFFNVPRHWIYLVGFEYGAVNKRGEPKITKGGKPVIRRIDHVDLLILDRIRGYQERSGLDCFIGLPQLTDDIGFWQREKEVAERMLQLASLGFIHVKRKFYEGQRLPKLILTVDSQLIEDAATARRESILEAQRINSRTCKSTDMYRIFGLLEEYLEEYIEEYSEEHSEQYSEEYSEKDREQHEAEHRAEQVQEYEAFAGADCEPVPCTKPSTSDGGKDMDILNMSYMRVNEVSYSVTKPDANPISLNTNIGENEAESVSEAKSEDTSNRNKIEHGNNQDAEHEICRPVPIYEAYTQETPEEWPREVQRPRGEELKEIEPLLVEVWNAVEDYIDYYDSTMDALSQELREEHGCCDLLYVQSGYPRDAEQLNKILQHLRPTSRSVDYEDDLPF